jgi:hypothetical protein
MRSLLEVTKLFGGNVTLAMTTSGKQQFVIEQI